MATKTLAPHPIPTAPTPSMSAAAPVPPRTSAAGSRVHLAGLDELRAVAVVLVLLFHLAPAGVVPGGFVGVDVFFVISGFLITTLLVRERERTGRIRLRAFWARRARRLLPAVVLLILVTGTAATILGGDLLVRLGSQILGALTFSSNWILIAQGSSYFDQSAPELYRNLWSLAVEEQFYLVWPLLLLVLLLVPRAARLITVGALAVASVVAMAVLEPHGVTRVYYGTDTHSFGILLGAVLALAPGRGSESAASPGRGRRAARAALGVVGLGSVIDLALLLPQGSAWTFPWGLAAASVGTALVIRAVVLPRAVLGRILDVPPLRWIGVRSYGIYLWHWPLLVLAEAALPTWTHDPVERWMLGGLVALATVLVAAFSYGALEEPIRRNGLLSSARLTGGWWRWGSGSAFTATVAALAVLVAAGITGAGVMSDPGRTETQRIVDAGRRSIDAARPSAGPTAPRSTTPSASATPTPALAGDQVLVIGDSVTVAAAPELQSALPGVLVDGAVSRQMTEAPTIIEQHRAAGTLRRIVVVALGTNGGFGPSVLDRVRDELGPSRELVLVTTQEPRGWQDGVNATLTAYAQRYRNVELSNWHDAIQPHLDQLARDQIHFGGYGARLWTACLEDALQRLAELPALRDDRDYGGLPVPR